MTRRYGFPPRCWPLALLPLALAGCAPGIGYRAPETPLPAQWQALGATSGAVATASATTATPASGSGANDAAATPGSVSAGGGATVPALPPAVPARFAARDAAADAAALAAWWTRFGDPVLDGLVRDALAHNLDLRTAQAQLREARAARQAAGAELGPSVTASASAASSKSSRATGSGATRELYSAGFDASWEPDLFGRLRSGRAAAEASLGSAQEQLRDTRVTLVAEVARNYIELRTAQQRLALAEASLAARRETLQLATWRQQAGLVSELDVAQARTELESARAGLPALQASVVAARHRLAVLLGQAPGALDARLALAADAADAEGGHGSADVASVPPESPSRLDDGAGTTRGAATASPALSAALAVPRAPAGIAVGIPADTLRQRPDVRAAERRLAAQAARLGEARAARYPSLRLSGSIGWEALSAQGLGDGGSLARSLLASLTVPIFDAGRIRAAIGVQDARLEQARIAYEAAVLLALEDVENALTGLSRAQERVARLADAVAAARDTRTIADYRYQSGLADFLAVLDSQRTLLSLEDQQAIAAGDLAAAQVRLYKALGGGWQVPDDSRTTGRAAADQADDRAVPASVPEPK